MMTTKFRLIMAAMCFLLTACGGVNVGNALVQVGSEETIPPTLESVSLLSSLGLGHDTLFQRIFTPQAVTLSEFSLHISGVSLLPQAECDSLGSTLPSEWIRKKTALPVDLLDNTTAGKMELSVSLAYRVCAIRMLLGPDLQTGKSLFLEGTLGDGRAVEVSSENYHPLVLRSAAALNLFEGTGNGFETVFHRSTLFDDLDLELLSGNPVQISPAGTPVVFRAVMRRLRQRLRGYRLETAGGVIASDRSIPLQKGDEDSESLLSGESD